MTHRELFEKLFGVKTHITNSCQCISCQGHIHCDTCHNKNFWDDEVDFKKVFKLVLNAMYGTQLKVNLTPTGVEHLKEAFKNGSTQAVFPMNEPVDGWEKLPKILSNKSWGELKELLDDAEANGFEVKIENGTIYTRERIYQNTDSVQDMV